jgi:hypothetical protein
MRQKDLIGKLLFIDTLWPLFDSGCNSEDTTANVSNPKADLLETHPREDDDDGSPAKKSKRKS